MHRCGWCRQLSSTLRQKKRICGKAAFSRRTHNWLIYWVLCISVRTCLCVRVCAWGGLIHYAWLWSVMSGCHCLLLIMDNWYDTCTCVYTHTHTHIQFNVKVHKPHTLTIILPGACHIWSSILWLHNTVNRWLKHQHFGIILMEYHEFADRLQKLAVLLVQELERNLCTMLI